MTIDPGFILAAVLALIAGIGWLVRLESEIKRAKERQDEIDKRMNERHNDLRDEFNRLRNRIEAGKVYVFRRSPGAEPEGEDA